MSFLKKYAADMKEESMSMHIDEWLDDKKTGPEDVKEWLEHYRRRANLDKVYSKIPKVTGCKKGCTECCGPVPCTREEFDAIPDILEKLAPVCDEQGERMMVCRFKAEIGCLIYDYRPLICRLFGAVNDPGFRCPNGAKAVKPFRSRTAKRLVTRIAKGEHFIL